ncbi:hypothetical protein [Mycobacterium sp. SMC-8]|uniref:hypothetical protein n=1 Tax=Mycobacterium sp. SMC-8 TaxID=2857060 RepID=UPI0021B31468|nr:hypothetical protein [Mycobacterium sp. SMC-8]
MASSTAAAGISRKLANSDIATSRALRSGAVISVILSPNPIASMLDTTKISVAMGTACCSTAIIALTSVRLVRFGAARGAGSQSVGPR